MYLGKTLQCIALAAALFLLALPSVAQTKQPEAPAWAADFDALFEKEMAARHLPGAVFVVVADGKVAYKQGYGVADLDTKKPVSADDTLFRIASVSKLFTATAVMQLAEAGKLDFTSDVNTWLGEYALPDQGFGPITLNDLLTHTAGFDDRYIGMSTLTQEDRLTLAESVRKLRPERIIPPGKILSYSNYGYTLAGYLVERLSGMPFHQYVDEHILAPLGMEHAGFMLQDADTPNLATGYVYRNGAYEVMPYDYSNDYPAGSFMVTGDAMTRFMLAHLQHGGGILQPETSALMQETHFRHAPGLVGWCYGFEEDRVRGVRMLVHGGSTSGFTTQFVLVPDFNAGYFFSCNHEATVGNPGGIVYPINDLFFGKVLGVPQPADAPPAGQTFAHAPGIAGPYRMMRFSRHSLAKVSALLDDRQAELDADGSLHFNGGTFAAIGDNLWEEPGSGRRVAFLPAGDATPPVLAIGTTAFEQVPAWDTPAIQQAFMALALLLLILPQPIAALLRRRRGTVSPLRAGWRLIALTAILMPVFVVVVGYTLITLVPIAIFWGPSPALAASLVLPLIGVACVLAALLLLAARWSREGIAPLDRGLYIASCAGALMSFAWLYHWNLLGYWMG
ncbi:MAG: serine hydrolase [Candidatus Hydrogenedens sp.]|nr:serine hydrolase [Candidatus Hydrogenedens sp.]